MTSIMFTSISIMDATCNEKISQKISKLITSLNQGEGLINGQPCRPIQ